MINQSELIKQMKALTADTNSELLEIPADKLEMPTPEEISDFYRDIAPLVEGYPLVSHLDLKTICKEFPANTVILGVDGSQMVLSPPNYRIPAVITNTAVFAFFPAIGKYDFRVYTNLYSGLEDAMVISQDATLYMLADETAGAAKYIREELKGNYRVFVLMDGLNFSSIENNLIRVKLNITKDIDSHPSKQIFDNAVNELAEMKAIMTTVTVKPRTFYISPVIQYNMCPYRDNPTMPMNCKICRERHMGYNFDCEPYSGITDATYLLNVIHAQPHVHGLYISAPIQHKKDMAVRYLIHPYYYWSARYEIEQALLETAPQDELLLAASIGSQLVMAGGNPYCLYHAHHLCTIDGQSRELINQIAKSLGLMELSAKALGKKFSPNQAQSLDKGNPNADDGGAFWNSILTLL